MNIEGSHAFASQKLLKREEALSKFMMDRRSCLETGMENLQQMRSLMEC